ncbi:MAG: RND transporter, partial [Sphingobacteriales bacterium]
MRDVFLNLPFYQSRLYNAATNAYLLGVRLNKDVLMTKGRSEVIARIVAAADKFKTSTSQRVYLSGLPLIRTQVADRIQAEMKIFLIGSVLLSVVILLMFFRSVSTTLLSLSVVLIGVVWTVAIIYLCGYQITLLTALMPSLVVVIGIPNCIYFINKYHTAYIASGDKKESLINMVGKMGVVTLFCNITAAIGFAVFALTESAVLKEFGVVAGLSIMVIFLVSFILLPAALSLLPAPGQAQLKYLNSRWITVFLERVETWAFNHKKWVLGVTGLVVIAALFGMARLKSVGYIVDDLPRTDKIYTDLRFFEQQFKGVMPLEVLIDTKKKNGLTGMRALAVFEKVDSLAQFMAARPEMAKPLSLAEGLKFAKQAFYDMDSTQYLLPNTFDGAFVGDYLKPSADTASGGTMNNILRSFMDSN